MLKISNYPKIRLPGKIERVEASLLGAPKRPIKRRVFSGKEESGTREETDVSKRALSLGLTAMTVSETAT